MKTADKAPTKREIAINYFIENFNCAKQEFLKHIIFEYNNSNGAPCVAIFSERGAKPEHNYRFTNESEASKFLVDQKAKIQRDFDREIEMMKKYEEERKGFENGKILVASWGWEQTNINFYVLIERKKDFAIIQEIGQHKSMNSTYGDRGTTIPDTGCKIGEPFRKKINKWACIDIESYKRARVWDGTPQDWTGYA